MSYMNDVMQRLTCLTFIFHEEWNCFDTLSKVTKWLCKKVNASFVSYIYKYNDMKNISTMKAQYKNCHILCEKVSLALSLSLPEPAIIHHEQPENACRLQSV